MFDLGPDIPQESLNRYLAPSIYYLIREEMIVGMIGNALKLRDRQSVRARQSLIGEMAVVLGSSHADWLPPLLHRLDVGTEVHLVQHEDGGVPATGELLGAKGIRNKLIRTHELSGDDMRRLGVLAAALYP